MADSCRLCQVFGETAQKLDDRLVHARSHLSMMRLVSQDGEVKLDDLYYQCFKENLETKGSPAAKNRLFQYCMQLFVGRCLNHAIPCAICDLNIQVVIHGQFHQSKMIEHACIHSKKSLTFCRHCQYHGLTTFGIVQHLRLKHSITDIRGNCVITYAIYEEEIRDMLKRCFGGDPKSLQMHPGRLDHQQSKPKLEATDVSADEISVPLTPVEPAVIGDTIPEYGVYPEITVPMVVTSENRSETSVNRQPQSSPISAPAASDAGEIDHPSDSSGISSNGASASSTTSPTATSDSVSPLTSPDEGLPSNTTPLPPIDTPRAALSKNGSKPPNNTVNARNPRNRRKRCIRDALAEHDYALPGYAYAEPVYEHPMVTTHQDYYEDAWGYAMIINFSTQEPEERIVSKGEALRIARKVLDSADNLSLANRRLILDFIAGIEGLPNRPEPLIVSIPLSKSEFDEFLPDSSSRTFQVITYFELDYETGGWKHTRKVRRLQDNDSEA